MSFNSSDYNNSVGNIKISEEVVTTVAKNATLEIDGIEDVSTANTGFKGFLTKTNYTKPIKIEISESVAAIQVSVVVDQAKRIPDLANAVQLNVKNAVQSMTGLAVSRVDVIIAGVSQQKQQEAE